MATGDDYRDAIRELDRPALLELWEHIKTVETPGWPPGRAFEYLVLRAFELEGAVVKWPFTIKLNKEIIEQIDGVVHVGGLSCLIETKDIERKLDAGPIAKLRNQLMRRPAHAIGAIFSRIGFTDSAKTLAKFLSPQTVLLWEGDEVELAISKEIMVAGLLAKFRHAVEEGFPDYNIQRPDFLEH